MTSLNRLSRLGGVSLLVLAVAAGGVLVEQTLPRAEAQQDAPRYAAAVPMGAPMSFADLVEEVSPSVVTIQVESDWLDEDGNLELGNIPERFRPELEREFEEWRRQQPEDEELETPTRRSIGSGFFITGDGYIVTNNHVVATADEITIGLSDGEEYPARIIGLDAQTDLALLKVDEDVEFPHVDFDPDANLRVGDWVIAVGNPFGLGGSVTEGIVSALGRETPTSTYNDFIQITAPINRGNSGGPTFDLHGNVIGVNSQIISSSGGNEGIGFAIPAETAEQIIEQLRENGRVIRGWLGVRIQNLDPDMAESLGIEDEQGAIVLSLVAGGPAADSGIEQGDVILAIDGEPVEDSRDLTRRVGNVPADESVEFRVLRDGRERTLRVQLGARPEEDALDAMPEVGSNDEEAGESADFFGVTLGPLDNATRQARGLGANDEGLVIEAVSPRSEAARKGLRPGDVIVEAGNEAVADIDDFRDAVQSARRADRSAILLLVQGRTGQRYVALQLDEDN